MKNDNIKNIDDIKKHCRKNGIICPDHIAKKIFECFLFEQYSKIDLTEGDVILQLFDYYAHEKDIDKEDIEEDREKLETKNNFIAKLKKFLIKTKNYLLSTPYDDIEDNTKNIDDTISIDVVYNYILDNFKIELTANELNKIYDILIDMGLNDRYNKINNILSVAIDNYIVEVLVNRTIIKYVEIPNINQLKKLVTHMQNNNLAIELIKDPHYEAYILEEYKKNIEKTNKMGYTWKYIFESKPTNESDCKPVRENNFNSMDEKDSKPKKH